MLSTCTVSKTGIPSFRTASTVSVDGDTRVALLRGRQLSIVIDIEQM
jgi:hypothetical protein